MSHQINKMCLEMVQGLERTADRQSTTAGQIQQPEPPQRPSGSSQTINLMITDFGQHRAEFPCMSSPAFAVQ